MFEPAAPWSQPQSQLFSEFKGQFKLQINPVFPYDFIAPEHKNCLHQIAAVVSVFHAEAKSPNINWRSVRSLLGHWIISAIQRKDSQVQEVQGGTVVVGINESTNNVVFEQVITLFVSAMVRVKIQTVEYYIYYELDARLTPVESLWPLLPQEHEIPMYIQYLTSMLDSNSEHNVTNNYGVFPNIDVQKMAWKIAARCQPVYLAPKVHKKVTVKLSVCIKSLTQLIKVQQVKDFIFEIVALIAGMQIEHKIQSKWTNFILHSAWELFLRFRYLDYAPKERHVIDIHYQADEENFIGLHESLASHIHATLSIIMNNMTYDIFYEIECGYYPDKVMREHDAPLPKGVILTSVNDPSPIFRYLVKRVEPLERVFLPFINNRINDEFVQAVAQECFSAPRTYTSTII